MSRTARLCRGAGLLTLGGILLSGVAARGAGDPPLTEQLNDLGRQALSQGASGMAQSFFQKALQLDPKNVEAARGLQQSKTARDQLMRVALQDPAPAQPAPPPAGDLTPPAPGTVAPPPAPGIPASPAPAPITVGDAQPPTATSPRATLESAGEEENIAREQLNSEIEQRLQEARRLVQTGEPAAAIERLKLALNLVRSNTEVSERVRTALDRRIQAQLLNTARDEERINIEQAEQRRLAAAEEQRQRAVSEFTTNQSTIKSMMAQFDILMGEGIYNVLYNGGYGNIATATAPFAESRLLAQHARALMRRGMLPYSDWDPAPYAGIFTSTTGGFLAQEIQFELLKEYRYMLTMQDVARAAVPFPDDQIIEYPEAERWRTLSERRIARYGKAVDVFDRDPKTKQILQKLDEPISMSFPNETPLEDILKYVKQATTGPNDNGIPIYVDPVGLQEADKTQTSPVQIDLEGVPLKTTLRLILKQLGLTYTVKDGYMYITSASSEDQQVEIRVYPVADLAIIPLSLMGGGGGGGMGGGMGGMGGGMGGMGGGGMGGGMGGMGGGMGGMGGMMSVPVLAPEAQDDASGAFLQKKSN